MGIRKKTGGGGLRAAVLAGLAAVLAAGCAPKEEAPKKPEGPIVARVGASVLTLEELRASIPSEYSHIITREQNVQYVRQWINTELLYNEALRLKIDQEPHIGARLEKMKKDLLSAEIISRGTTRSGAEVGEHAVREYYEANREQFKRESYVVRYDAILVDDLNLAWEIRRNATHETFKELAKKHSKDPPGLDEGTTPYVSLDAIPPVVRSAVAGAAVPSITGPYRSEDGFHILRVLGKFEKGTIASLDEVRDEIMSRLSNMTQKDETERLISDIRSRTDVEFNIDLVPGPGAAGEEGAEKK